MAKEARIYNEEKTVYLKSSDEQAVQLHVKE